MSGKPIIIYALRGSQFVFKVLAALQARQIPHYVHFVPFDEKKRSKMLPSGGLLVPEMQVGVEKDDRIIVQDSEKILRWLDENMDAKLFPTEQASELSVRASSKTLAASVWYYNWVDQKGYENSMRKSLARSALPAFIPFFRGCIIDMATGKTRSKHREWVTKALELEANPSELDDEPKMRKRLMEELEFFQSLLVSEDQPYLLENTTEPTAVDFSVYAQVERLVGAGTASDVVIDPAIQELKDDGNGLDRLWKWHDSMREKFPVKFLGKRIPEDIASKLDNL